MVRDKTEQNRCLRRFQVKVGDHIQSSALDDFCEMDGRKSRYIQDLLDWYREEDAEGLRRSVLDELIENKTALNGPRGEIRKREKRWKSDTSNKKIVMKENIEQHSVMNEKIVKSEGCDESIHIQRR